MLAPMKRSSGFDGAGDFFLGDDCRLSFRDQAEHAPYNYMGVHITTADIVDAVSEDVFSLSKLWRQKAQQGRLFGAVLAGDWMHVGDPHARDLAEARFAKSEHG
jgi:N-acetyl-alpha-D-muramate 1-phosphate uridylyltransferase